MNLLSGHGPFNAKIAIVLDYPSKEDHHSGVLLSGKAGSFIDRILRKHGLNLADCYITACLKSHPENVGTKDKKLREQILNDNFAKFEFESLLKQELEEIKPNVILALGERALNILTNENGIGNFRGSILPVTPLWALDAKVVPTYHPRTIWEQFNLIPIVDFDIARACDLKDHVGKYQRKELIWVCRSANAFNNWWQRAQYGEFLTVDIETWMSCITCFGFCHDGLEAVSVALWDCETQLDRIMLYRGVANVLRSKIPKVNQNIRFDANFSNKWAMKIHNIMDDTMLLAHSCYPELPKALQFLTSIHTDQPYYKDEGGSYDPKSGNRLYLYNAKDALTTWQVYKSQVKDAKEIGVWKFHREQVWPLFYHYSKMEDRGIRIDFAQRDKLLRKYDHLCALHEMSIVETYGQPINCRSDLQVGKFVYEFLNCPVRKHKTEKGDRYDTDKETLEDLYINHVKDPLVKKLLKEIILVRKIKTIRSYILMIVHKDGRMRCSYNLSGTKGGRTSASTSLDDVYFLLPKKIGVADRGGSFQVIPKRPYEAEEFENEIFGVDIPSMFVPSPGYCFIEGDGSQAEARVVSVLAEDYSTLTRMDRPTTRKNEYGVKDDYHTETVTQIMGIAFEQVKKSDRENYGKRPRHAGNYDMGDYRLSHMIFKPQNVCKEILNKFHNLCPNVRGVFHAQVMEFVRAQGILKSPQGRIRQFFGRQDPHFFKQAYAQIPQATVSDHTKYSMVLLAEKVPQAEFLVEKHDSLLAEVPIELRDVYCQAFKEVYERPIDFRPCSLSRDFQLVIPAEIRYSEEGWADSQMTTWKG